jgi:hypothetical protein
MIRVKDIIEFTDVTEYMSSKAMINLLTQRDCSLEGNDPCTHMNGAWLIDNVTDLLKEFLGSASVNTAITQQYRTLRFSACPPMTSHCNSKEGSCDLRGPHSRHTPATRDVSNSEESCISPWDTNRGVILKWIHMQVQFTLVQVQVGSRLRGKVKSKAK